MLVWSNLRSTAAAAEEAEQVDEQVDEVKVEAQSAHRGYLAHHRGVGLGTHALDGLGIPSSEANEDEHTDNADNQVKHRTLEKDDIDQHTRDESDECHDQD